MDGEASEKHPEIYHVDAFSDRPFAGNPAAVVIEMHKPSDDAFRQQLAAELRLSETAFVSPASDGSPAWDIAWFSPTTEVPLCGHATLAAAAALRAAGVRTTPLLFRTRVSGDVSVADAGPTGVFAMTFTPRPPAPPAPDAAATGRALLAALFDGAFSAAALHFEPHMRKLLVRVDADPNTLRAAPAYPDRMLSVAQEHLPPAQRVGGVSVFALRSDGAAEDAGWSDAVLASRYFNPWAGIPEDPVNGSSHTALACVVAAAGLGERHTEPDGAVRVSATAFMASARGGRLSLAVVLDPGTGTARSVAVGGPTTVLYAGRLLART